MTTIERPPSVPRPPDVARTGSARTTGSARFGRSRWLDAVRDYLPRGQRLSEESFASRHRVARWTIVFLTVILLWVGTTTGESLPHIFLELLPIVIPGIVAWRATNRLLVTLAAAWALMACSSTLVHMTDGLIEAHFLFFVLLPLVSIYQDWRAFLGAIGFVVLSHAVVGTLSPESMYNHAAAINNPIKWAIIHAMFVAALVIILVIEWKFAELEQRRAAHALRNLQQTEVLLVQAQKLESVGQLAAGVAHEINTPVQYLSDNAIFLNESFTSLLGVFDELATLARTADSAAVDRCLDVADIEFLRDEIPGALEHSRDGLQRVSEIVRAMKDFSHPGGTLDEVDVNAAISSTVTVSRNEWKYVAETDLQLDPDLPLTRCHAGQIKQVVLNLIVNAAHAIGDGLAEGEMGTITVATGRSGLSTRICITDTGCGMDEATRQQIFDPFFTTKEVGRGTGQGLSMVHRIVDAHGGKISVESTVGVGSTFIVDLPTMGVVQDNVVPSGSELPPPAPEDPE